MLRLRNLSITAKVFSIIGLFMVVMAGVATIGITALSTVNHDAVEMRKAGIEAITAAQMLENVLRLTRADFQVAADPTPESLTQTRQEAQKFIAQLEEELVEIKALADPEEAGLIAEIERLLREYEHEFEGTLQIAERNSAFIQQEPARLEILRAVRQSGTLSDELNARLEEFVHHMEQREEQLAHDAESSYETASLMMITASVVAVAIGLVLGFFISRTGIVRPINGMAEAMQKIAQGETDMKIDTDAGAEIGRMYRALETLRQEVAKAFELRQMVEEMPINVMSCELTDFKIVFANKTSLTTLKSLQHLLPIPVETIVGSSIDVFHKVPERQRRLLSDPSNLPYETLITLGDEKLSLKASAIRDKNGKYVAPMLTWNVVTEQIKLASSVKEVVDIVASASTELESTATAMTGTAEETNSQASAASAAVEEVTANIQTVASASEELSSSLTEVSRNVSQSATIAREAVEQASTATERVESLVKSADKIGEVVNLISDIAEQTNLLALNATIEAARAGEAGKGFAVVASEVKNLANQTAKATEEISAQIGGIQTATGDAAQAIRSIAETITKVDEIASAIAAAVEEQGSATQEIAGNAQQVAQGAGEVSSNVATLSKAASETGTAASQVLSATQGLAKHATDLSGQVEKFLKALNAA